VSATLRLTRHAFASQKWLGALGPVFPLYEAISYEGRAARGELEPIEHSNIQLEPPQYKEERSGPTRRRRIAIFVSNEGVEHAELTSSWSAIEEAGGQPILLATERRPSHSPTALRAVSRAAKNGKSQLQQVAAAL
jgi:hypothetical protein